jgi:hypothetical protein
MIDLEPTEKANLLNIFEKYDIYGITHISPEYDQTFQEIVALFEEVQYQTIDLVFNIHEALNKDGVYLKKDIFDSLETVYESPDELKECFGVYFAGDDMRPLTRRLFVENAKAGVYDDFMASVYEQETDV